MRVLVGFDRAKNMYDLIVEDGGYMPEIFCNNYTEVIWALKTLSRVEQLEVTFSDYILPVIKNYIVNEL